MKQSLANDEIAPSQTNSRLANCFVGWAPKKRSRRPSPWYRPFVWSLKPLLQAFRQSLSDAFSLGGSCSAPFALLLCAFVVLTQASAFAGTITGSVHAEGKPGTEAESSGGRYDSRQYKFVERVNYADMRDFVVYIDGVEATNLAAPSQPAQVTTRRITQKGAQFEPHVLPIRVGTTVEWPNHDSILHNVFSFSDAKPFDLGLYKDPEVKRVTFDKVGRVDVFCSIHSRMNCVILVLPNPWFASTDARGRYTLENVPAGTYKLKAWHERLPSDVKEITVPATGEVKVDFTLGIKNLPRS